MTDASLYQWPPAARMGRVVAKTKIYEHARSSTAVRERFVAEVQRITWAYKLADATINLGADAAVPEIQVFVIDAKDDDVSDQVLAAVDRSVPFPIIFEINRGAGAHARTRMVAAPKQLGNSKPRLSEYFSSPWHQAAA